MFCCLGNHLCHLRLCHHLCYGLCDGLCDGLCCRLCNRLIFFGRIFLLLPGVTVALAALHGFFWLFERFVLVKCDYFFFEGGRDTVFGLFEFTFCHDGVLVFFRLRFFDRFVLLLW